MKGQYLNKLDKVWATYAAGFKEISHLLSEIFKGF